MQSAFAARVKNVYVPNNICEDPINQQKFLPNQYLGRGYCVFTRNLSSAAFYPTAKKVSQRLKKQYWWFDRTGVKIGDIFEIVEFNLSEINVSSEGFD